MKQALRTCLAVSCCAGIAAALAAHAAPQTGTGGANKIGQFVIKNVNGSTSVQFRKDTGTRIVMRGQNLSITSARYDIAAPQIVLFGKKSAPTNADATGGVKIGVRNPEQQQDTTLTSDTAQYVGASPGKNPHIYAVGNVRAVTRTPDFEPGSPLVTNSRKATVELLPNGEYDISFDGFGAIGTPLEKPAAKPAPRKKP